MNNMLMSFGIEAGIYDNILSAGESAYQALLKRDDPRYAGLGYQCLHIGYGDISNVEWIDKLPLKLVNCPDDANFILVTGILAPDKKAQDYELMFSTAIANRIPLICANPDHTVVIDGTQYDAVGILAALYERLGGEVVYHGKPHPEIFRNCLKTLAPAESTKIAVVGDSLSTDILGAKSVDLDTIFITSSGVHSEDLGVKYGESPTEDKLENLFRQLSVFPTYTMPIFSW
jgi:HAD superfamily hydrolase (TIGR01459 family)